MFSKSWPSSSGVSRKLICLVLLLGALPVILGEGLPKIRVAPDGRSFVTDTGEAFMPLGVTYYRPGTGWAPQVWKQFDLDATRADFARMKELGVNCVRVFLSYGSFLTEPDRLSSEGLAKFDQLLALAEASGIYVHPTGPDHWEGLPDWARGDRIADEKGLAGLESFWSLFAKRYAGRGCIFAYDLRNEPEVAWESPAMKAKWPGWLRARYGSLAALASAWGITNTLERFEDAPVPEAKDRPGDRHLLDYQHFREDLADDWTRRQVNAIRRADPAALVTVGLIQWSVPSMLPRVSHYAGFSPQRQAKFLDFMEVHFYPLDHGFYEYANREDELRNLAYLQTVVRAVAQTQKPVVLAEFGWYGGGRLSIDDGKHPPASQEQQARWCVNVIKTTRGLAVGWLNWGLSDQPEAHDVSQLTGLLTADSRLKSWGQEFCRVAHGQLAGPRVLAPAAAAPALDWDKCLTSVAAGNAFRDQVYRGFTTPE